MYTENAVTVKGPISSTTLYRTLLNATTGIKRHTGVFKIVFMELILFDLLIVILYILLSLVLSYFR